MYSVRFNVAQQLNLVCFRTFFDFVLFGKFVPSLFLGRRQHPGAAAERAYMIQGVENG